MRHLTPGDVSAKLERIQKAPRGRKWRKRARDHLLRDAGADPARRSKLITMRDGGKVCTKKRFSCIEQANLALWGIHRSPNIHRKEDRAYFCRNCNAYHLTSQEQQSHERDTEEAHSTQEDPGHQED